MLRNWAFLIVNCSIDYKKRAVRLKYFLDDIIIIGNSENWVFPTAGDHKVWISTKGLLLIRKPERIAYIWSISTSLRCAGLKFLV